jgi:hypothetical protein
LLKLFTHPAGISNPKPERQYPAQAAFPQVYGILMNYAVKTRDKILVKFTATWWYIIHSEKQTKGGD